MKKDKPARPKRSERILVGVTPEVKERLQRLAADQHRSLSETGYVVLLAGLEALKRDEDKRL